MHDEKIKCALGVLCHWECDLSKLEFSRSCEVSKFELGVSGAMPVNV